MTLFQQIKEIVSRRESLLLLLFLALPVLAGGVLVVSTMHHTDWLRGLPLIQKVLLFAGVSILIAFSFIPNTIAGLLAGYVFGFWGLAGMCFSYILASLMGYYLGRTIDSGLKETIFRIWPKAEMAFQKLEGHSVPVVITFRLMPAPPFAVGNLLLAWFRMPLKPFLVGSFLGMLPRMVLVVWVGSNAKDIWNLLKNPMHSPEIQNFTWCALLLVGLAAAWWFGRKHLR